MENDDSETDSDAFSIGRVTVVSAAEETKPSEGDVRVKVTVGPRKAGSKQELTLTVDSGVTKTLLAEKHWKLLLERNAGWKLDKAKTTFRPYGTKYTLPVLGKAKVKVWSQNGARIRTTVYVVEGQQESLLGRVACEALGIITITPGGGTGKVDKVKRMTMVGLAVKEQVNRGELDRKMEKLLDQYPQLFQGIGMAKVPPIHVHMTGDVQPVTQKLRPVPVSMMEPLKEKLDMYVQEGVIEGPLGADQATGWVHNVVLTGKKWDPKAIRMNLDTRLMKQAVVKAQYPIPTSEQLRHQFVGSNRYSVLDLNDAFHQFMLDEESQELFKFTTPFGIYKY